MLAKIEQNFLKPLHVGLNMSKAHYEAEIKSKKENRRGQLLSFLVFFIFRNMGKSLENKELVSAV